MGISRGVSRKREGGSRFDDGRSRLREGVYRRASRVSRRSDSGCRHAPSVPRRTEGGRGHTESVCPRTGRAPSRHRERPLAHQGRPRSIFARLSAFEGRLSPHRRRRSEVGGQISRQFAGREADRAALSRSRETLFVSHERPSAGCEGRSRRLRSRGEQLGRRSECRGSLSPRPERPSECATSRSWPREHRTRAQARRDASTPPTGQCARWPSHPTSRGRH
jgi:hypothetical protein